MSPAPADRPSLGVVVAGGVGVVAVVAFVAALAVGGRATETPGELVRLVRADGPAGLAVLAGRCLDQRVGDVVVADGSGVRWRITSRKGSIARRFVVGAPPPLGFEVVRPFAGSLVGEVRAEVVFRRDGDRRVDARVAPLASLGPEGDELASGPPACGGDAGPGRTVVLFALAAVAVVAGYVGMLRRRVRTR